MGSTHTKDGKKNTEFKKHIFFIMKELFFLPSIRPMCYIRKKKENLKISVEQRFSPDLKFFLGEIFIDIKVPIKTPVQSFQPSSQASLQIPRLSVKGVL